MSQQQDPQRGPPALSEALVGEALTGYRNLAMRRLPAVVGEVLDQADDALFDLVQKTTLADEQQAYFMAMRELRRHRNDIEQRFRQHLGDAFDALQQRNPLVGTVAQQLERRRKGLSLVEADELEEQLAAEQMAAVVERRNGEALALLNRRLARLLGLAELEVSANPAGPVHVSLAFRHGLSGLELPLNARLVLYKLFERELLAVATATYSEAHQRLAQLGIELPPERERGRPQETEITRQTVGDRQDRSSLYVPAKDREALRPSGVSQGGSQHPGESVDDIYVAVRDLCQAVLEARRSVRRGAEPVATLAERQALGALFAMQREVPGSLLRAADDPQLSLSSLLKQELLQTAERQHGLPTGSDLDSRDEQAVFLVGLLFDVLLSQRSYERSVRQNFVRMSVPYARAAMLDQHLFDSKTHPARQLLNLLAEACDGNRGDSHSERDLLQRVTQVVERLNAEFVEDITVFAELRAEFSAFFEQYKKRVELAERRAAEAQRGRERLDEARIMASMELASLMGARELPPVYDVLLSRYWTHHLAVTFLREGITSQRYIDARRQGERLWRIFLDCENGSHPPVELESLLLPVLASSGVTGPAAEQVHDAVLAVLQDIRLGRVAAARSQPLPVALQGVFPAEMGPEPTAVEASAAPAAAATASADLPPQRPQLQVVGGTDTLQFDPADVERIRALSLGSWVEFVDETGELQPAKLSWISPISSRLLFVNRRGARQCAASAEELAVLLRQGRMSLRVADSAFERALSNVLGRLKEALPDQAAS